jgi:hypothetical protein
LDDLIAVVPKTTSLSNCPAPAPAMPEQADSTETYINNPPFSTAHASAGIIQVISIINI